MPWKLDKVEICSNCLKEYGASTRSKSKNKFCSRECYTEARNNYISPVDPMEKWILKVDKTPGQGPNGDCWIWTGSKQKKGTYNYGIFFWPNGSTMSAHVASWWLFTGDMETKGFHICHHCDNPPCVNPEHLFKGTAKDNHQDMIVKGRVFRGLAKLTDEEALEARSLYAIGDTACDLALKYNFSPATMYAILEGKTYKHLPLIK